jgi:hypothetical protein
VPKARVSLKLWSINFVPATGRSEAVIFSPSIIFGKNSTSPTKLFSFEKRILSVCHS